MGSHTNHNSHNNTPSHTNTTERLPSSVIETLFPFNSNGDTETHNSFRDLVTRINAFRSKVDEVQISKNQTSKITNYSTYNTPSESNTSVPQNVSRKNFIDDNDITTINFRLYATPFHVNTHITSNYDGSTLPGNVDYTVGASNGGLVTDTLQTNSVEYTNNLLTGGEVAEGVDILKLPPNKAIQNLRNLYSQVLVHTDHSSHGSHASHGSHSDHTDHDSHVNHDSHTNHSSHSNNHGNHSNAHSNSGGGCVLKGTRVYLDFKNTILVENLKAGDYVLSYNVDTKEFTRNKVLRVDMYEVKIYVKNTFSNGTILYNTSDHSFWTGETWAAVEPEKALRHLIPTGFDTCDLLEVGTKILTTQNFTTVSDLKTIESEENIVMYNPVIEDTHCYFPEGVLMHNVKEGDW